MWELHTQETEEADRSRASDDTQLKAKTESGKREWPQRDGVSKEEGSGSGGYRKENYRKQRMRCNVLPKLMFRSSHSEQTLSSRKHHTADWHGVC